MSKTIRQLLNRRKAICAIGMLIGFVVFVRFGIFREGDPDEWRTYAFAGFGLAFISMLLAYFIIRCPRCRTAWGQLAMGFGSPVTIGRNIVVCPFCRAEVDMSPDDPDQPERP